MRQTHTEKCSENVTTFESDIHYNLVIEAGKTEKEYWKDLWRFKELFFFLAWRDILVRYKQTVIGIAWSVFRPLLTTFSFLIVFHAIAKLDSGETPYAITILVALLPWQLFSNILSETSNSLIANSNLISKVYFPRMIVPLSTTIVSLIDFAISVALLVILMIAYNFVPSSNIVFLPFFLFLAFLLAIGAGLGFCALNVKYRDFRYIIPLILQFGLYISPIGFSSDIVPEKWRLVYYLNPMVAIIDGFRWCIIGDSVKISLVSIFMSLFFLGLFLLVGTKYFRSTEKSFADKI